VLFGVAKIFQYNQIEAWPVWLAGGSAKKCHQRDAGLGRLAGNKAARNSQWPGWLQLKMRKPAGWPEAKRLLTSLQLAQLKIWLTQCGWLRWRKSMAGVCIG